MHFLQYINDNVGFSKLAFSINYGTNLYTGRVCEYKIYSKIKHLYTEVSVKEQHLTLIYVLFNSLRLILEKHFHSTVQ